MERNYMGPFLAGSEEYANVMRCLQMYRFDGNTRGRKYLVEDEAA